ncbi:MAG: TonB-dependent receptor domain-containing protein [Sphingomonas sp.]
MQRTAFACLLAGSMIGLTPVAAAAQSPATYQFDLPAQDLGDALRAVAARAGLELYAAASDVNGLPAPALHGELTTAQAIDHLLRGTDLTARFENGAVIIARSGATTGPNDTADANIVVTGTHIRHSEPTSPVITAIRREIEDAGDTDLGGYVRDLPQNFGGGQNPGIVGLGVQGGNANLGSTSALNLRGLGADATLTLFNGHRVAYDGAVQGVDISAIPLAAVDRVEIVPDGSSALYGSDAVGGVANVILRRDYSGLWTSARIGSATDGGDFQQEYSLVSGATWGDGGFMVAGDLNRSTAITAGQRSVTRTLDPSYTLLPAQRQYSAVFNGHQALARTIEFKLDGQYSDRTSAFELPFSSASSARTNGTVYHPRVESYSATPTIEILLPEAWRVVLQGTYAKSRTEAAGTSFSAGAPSSTSQVSYDNQLQNIEARADGDVVTLPGGPLGVALGAGFRRFSLAARSTIRAGSVAINTLDIDRREHVAYAFGELAVPIIGSGNSSALLDFLQLTAAVRYERYAGIADVASPKLGIVYRPTPSLTLRGDWGRSFKAPTFYERYRTYQALLERASDVGATGPVADRTILYIAGGNADLKPERASTWSATATYAPASFPGLKLEASYYNIRYRNRVVTPLTSVLGVLDNPVYASLVTFNPSPATLSALIAPAAGVFGLQNFTGQPYDPATVYAVIDGRDQNTARQFIEGVDLSASYGLDIGSSKLTLSGAASYIDSDRTLIAGGASAPAAGVIFMPPHWRFQGAATVKRDNVMLSARVHYIDGVLDDRIPPHVGVNAFCSADLVARLSTGRGPGLLENIDVTATVSNIFNEKPGIVRTAAPTDATYDSTNYTVIGRSIDLTIAKRW